MVNLDSNKVGCKPIDLRLLEIGYTKLAYVAPGRTLDDLVIENPFPATIHSGYTNLDLQIEIHAPTVSSEAGVGLSPYGENRFRIALDEARQEAEELGLPPVSDAAMEAALELAYNMESVSPPHVRIASTATLKGGARVMAMNSRDTRRLDIVFDQHGDCIRSSRTSEAEVLSSSGGDITLPEALGWLFGGDPASSFVSTGSNDQPEVSRYGRDSFSGTISAPGF